MLRNYFHRGLVGAILLAVAIPATASYAPGTPRPSLAAAILIAQNDWNNLSDQEQRLLKDHRQQWNNYPPDYRSRLRQGADRYQQLSPEDRERVRRSREQYQNLDPQKREQLKRQYRERQDR